MQPTVSVIIPTRNRLEYLKKAIASVLQQSFKNYEIIITDNHSSDGTKDWCLEMVSKYKNIHYYRNEKNIGMVNNWNNGILKSQGKYITLLMDDDEWCADFLKKTSIILDRYDSVGIVSTNIKVVSMDSQITLPENYYRIYRYSRMFRGVECIIQYLQTKWLVGLPSCVLVRKAGFDRLGLFSPNGLDQEMWLRFCSQYNYYYIDRKLCVWRYGLKDSFTYTAESRELTIKSLRIVSKIMSYDYLNINDLFLVIKLGKKKINKILKQSVTDFSIKELINTYNVYDRCLLYIFTDYLFANAYKICLRLHKAIIN